MEPDCTAPLLEPRSRTPTGRILHLIGLPIRWCSSHTNEIAILLGPLVATCIWVFVRIDGDSDGKVRSMLAILCWVCTWWLTEALPEAITGLAPLFLLPLAEIETATNVASAYMNDTNFLMMGSFILAAALEHYQLHKRMALNMLVLLGGKRKDPWLLMLGFCAGTAFISMWIHNTAAAVMMMPVGLGVLQRMEGKSKSGRGGSDLEYGGKKLETEEEDEEEKKVKKDVHNFCRAATLAISYAATLGGMATLTGTGVNLILAGLYESDFPDNDQITYLQWLLFGFPLSLAMQICLWLILCLRYCPRSTAKAVANSLNDSHIRAELKDLGPISFPEVSVLCVFGVLILLWLTKSLGTSSGWGDLFDDYPGNGTVAILMASVLFIIPSRERPGEKLMDWKRCKGIHWNIILLLGGGFALADGMSASGLSDCISDYLDFLQSAPYILITPIIAILTGIMTEFTSNNSVATIFCALLAEVATSIGRHPLFLMVPGAVGAQFSFMLPIATPPNAVGYSTGYLRIIDMITIGFILKVIGLVFLSIWMPTIGARVFKTNSS